MTTAVNLPHRFPAVDPEWAAWPAGARVVLRRRLSAAESFATRDAASGEAAKTVTDVIGIVLSTVPGESVTVRTDAGGSREAVEVTVPVDQLVAAKRIPPRPPRRLPRQPVD